MTTEPLNLDEAAAGLADNGIDGPDLPYNPRALAAMRTADALLAELVQARADLASLGHWWCPNCEAVADVIDDDFCLRCSSQVEWCEPDTLSRAKAYAEKVKRARDEAWAEVERLSAALQVCEHALTRAEPTDAQVYAGQQASGAYWSDWTPERVRRDLPDFRFLDADAVAEARAEAAGSVPDGEVR